MSDTEQIEEFDLGDEDAGDFTYYRMTTVLGATEA